MDRALKERIIGAAVLVAVVVLVVPVFLDGRDDAADTVTTQIGLPGQSDSQDRTVVLERDRDAPMPGAAADTPRASSSTPPPQTVSQPQPAQIQPEERAPEPQAAPPEEPDPEPQPTQAPAAVSSSTGMWAVQLGSFGEQGNADRLAATLKSQGFAAFRSQYGSMHRVRVGPQKDRDTAEDMAEQLQRAGHNGKVVPHP
ncbi:MAG: SPOR domain-containing protein [Pseudomonadota bacterium]